MTCGPRLGGEPVFAAKQLRHYHSPGELSWDEWRLSHTEVERIDLENAASPDEADELEEMTADEMAVDGYYVVAGIARHEYTQGLRFLTLWDGCGLSEAILERMLDSIQPHECINPIARSYFVENNEGQRPSVRRKANLLLPIWLLLIHDVSRLPASRGGDTSQTFPPPVGSLLRATPAGV